MNFSSSDLLSSGNWVTVTVSRDRLRPHYDLRGRRLDRDPDRHVRAGGDCDRDRLRLHCLRVCRARLRAEPRLLPLHPVIHTIEVWFVVVRTKFRAAFDHRRRRTLWSGVSASKSSAPLPQRPEGEVEHHRPFLRAVLSKSLFATA